jgi:hypothetical protein
VPSGWCRLFVSSRDVLDAAIRSRFTVSREVADLRKRFHVRVPGNPITWFDLNHPFKALHSDAAVSFELLPIADRPALSRGVR